jgi:hypothetical protein
LTARAALYSLLSQDEELQEAGWAIYAAGALDTPREQRFVVIRWEATQVLWGGAGVDRVAIWWHDRDKDYGAIDLAAARLSEILRDAVHVLGADGWVLTQASWDGDSPDLFDDVLGTVCRFSSATIGSRLGSQ